MAQANNFTVFQDRVPPPPELHQSAPSSSLIQALDSLFGKPEPRNMPPLPPIGSLPKEQVAYEPHPGVGDIMNLATPLLLSPGLFPGLLSRLLISGAIAPITTPAMGTFGRALGGEEGRIRAENIGSFLQNIFANFGRGSGI